MLSMESRPRAKLAQQMETGISSLKTYTEMMTERLAQPDVHGHELLPHWIKALKKIRRSITRMIRTHK